MKKTDFTLYVAMSDLNEEKEIEKFKLKSVEEVQQKIRSYGLREDRVYLLCMTPLKDDEPTFVEIIVTENLAIIKDFIESYEIEYDLLCPKIAVHLQMYESYEDAYAVALDMREGNILCYVDNKAALEFNEETQSFRIGQSERELETDGFKLLAIFRNTNEAESVSDYLRVTTRLMGIESITYAELLKKTDDLTQFLLANDKSKVLPTININNDLTI